MYKRLLALLVFIPMFLIAWYARNHREPVGGPATAPIARSSEATHGGGDRGGYTRHSGDRPRSDRERRTDRRSGAAEDQPGVFDFYLLNLSWSPEFCSTHPDKAECRAHPGFVLHGLWPQNNDGSYPEHCSDAAGPANTSTYADLYPDAGLLRHEWSTHGTCSGLSADAFFQQARAALRSVKIPAALSAINRQASMAPEAILTQFVQANPSFPRTSLALSCGNNYLTAIEVCFDRNLHAVACSNIRSCRANSIRIVPPGGSASE